MVQLNPVPRTPLEVAISSRSHVLISGPTGVGKSRLAREIHQASSFATGPFVSVNLAALHDGTFESELFGHERGAFTGADRKKTGQIELASNGTLFLDEIGELSLKQQARLLEFLQTGFILPLGSRHPIRVAARVILATHRDLAQDVKAGRFREDLFFRLRVVSIVLPSIAEIAADFDRFLHTCLEEVCAEKNIKIARLSESAAVELESYSWPGNFRELRHVLEYAVLSARSSEIDRCDLPAWFFESKLQAPRVHDASFPSESVVQCGSVLHQSVESDSHLSFQDAMDRSEVRLIQFALGRSRGNISQAARYLRMSKTTLLRRLRMHRIAPIAALAEDPARVQ